MSELTCTWTIKDIPCSGEVKKEPMFDGQFSVPVCEKHLEEHEMIITLSKNEYGIKHLLLQSPKERQKLFDELEDNKPEDKCEGCCGDHCK